MLVRGGARYLVICDNDTFEHGNLSRHTLTMPDEHTYKASALAAHLTSASPHVTVEVIVAAFPNLNSEQQNYISDCDLILDCTAEDDTLYAIEEHDWVESGYIVRISFGIHVRRVYVVGAPAKKFARSAVRKLLDPSTQEDWMNQQTDPFLREGPGCWHPVFPGRTDDVWAMAAMAVKELERLLNQGSSGVQGAMYKWVEDESFTGISREDLSCESTVLE